MAFFLSVNAHDLGLDQNKEEIEEYLVLQLQEKGIKDTLNDLQNFFDSGELSSNDCHTIAHRLGRKAEELFGKAKEAKFDYISERVL
ncbi:MAG: hypothetical protein Q7K42_02440, partial [Candidatus Diapherotrites archaeon]|nr:hypothetical protein [Candidatus Diapherotrites archaeon]